MSTGWENHEPSPIEFMHGRLMDEFHKWRVKRTENITVEIDGNEFSKIVVAAKLATYEKYKTLGLDKAVLKSVLTGDDVIRCEECGEPIRADRVAFHENRRYYCSKHKPFRQEKV